ncbi:MAG: hypothetical protein AB7X49_12580 [Geminicoccaceae bacterium]
MILLIGRAFDRALEHADRSVTLNPNDADAALYRGAALNFLGRHAEALAEGRRGAGLNPYQPLHHAQILGRILHEAGHQAEAAASYERIAPPRFHHHARLAACHAALGRPDAARDCVARTLAVKPDFSSAAWTATMPFRGEADRERLCAELVAPGLPP